METMNEIAGYLTPMSETDSSTVTANKNETVPTQGTSDSDENEPTSKPQRRVKGESAPSSSSVGTRGLVNAATKSSKSLNIHKFKYIPLRLSEVERNMLNVLNNALEVCEYTDVVDVTFSHTRKSKMSRIMESLIDILSIASGLMVCNDLLKGEQLLMGKSLNDNIPFFTDLFEIGRRYKIMNPSKMRNTYGKLMYILMDTESYSVKSELKINFVKPILTVYSFLESKESLEILQDPLWPDASLSIHNDLGEKSKRELFAEQQRKQVACQRLIEKYTSSKISADDIQRVIDSIADNEAYYEFNVKPVDRMLQILQESFDPNKPVDPFSLNLTSRGGGGLKKAFNTFSSLYSGYASSFIGGGAMLSHNHATQYKFVLQSLTLWREIMSNMPKLWICADADITNETYRLVDTGQGYQRLQGSPRVRREMSEILHRVQTQAGSWVGLSVVHLGDRDVPNGKIFFPSPNIRLTER